MHAQTCMVQLGNLHGWTSQLAWFSSPKCMVPLPALHGWTKKGSSRHCDPQHSTHICASTSPSGSVSPKIIQKRSQGATPGHRTLPLPNFARCDTTTSHPATLSCCTLQHRAIAPCHFLLSHPATQKARFLPPKSTLPDPFPAVGAGFGGFSKPDISAPFSMRCATGTTGILPVAM